MATPARPSLSNALTVLCEDAFFAITAARRVDAVIKTGRGPHALAFDTDRVRDEAGNPVLDAQGNPVWYSTMYVAHFTDSYVGVVDLDMRNQATFGAMYMTLGKPVPPKESQ